MLKTALFDRAIDEKCCSVDGGVTTPEDLTAQESPLPGICHPRQNQKNANARGSARAAGGGGGGGGGGGSRSWN